MLQKWLSVQKAFIDVQIVLVKRTAMNAILTNIWKHKDADVAVSLIYSCWARSAKESLVVMNVVRTPIEQSVKVSSLFLRGPGRFPASGLKSPRLLVKLEPSPCMWFYLQVFTNQENSHFWEQVFVSGKKVLLILTPSKENVVKKLWKNKFYLAFIISYVSKNYYGKIIK